MAKGRYQTTVESMFKDSTNLFSIYIDRKYYEQIKQFATQNNCTISIAVTEFIYHGLPNISTVYKSSNTMQRQYILPISLIKEIKKLAADKECRFSDIVNTCLHITDWSDVADSISNLVKST